jgi:EpsI family protein
MSRYAFTLMILLTTAFAHGATGLASKRMETGPAKSAIWLSNKIPSQILQFRQAAPDLPIPEHVRKNLETDAILMRNYISPSGVPVQLTIVYADKTRRSIHFPDLCLIGQGWEIQGKSPVPVGVRFVGQGLILAKGDDRQAVLYWFKTGEHFTGNYYVNSYHWARDKLLMREPSTMLVRLGTPIVDKSGQGGYRVLADFASGMAPILLENIP